ncbi:MAG: acetate kinase [Bacilli bacterium]|nr:acetate kinase [Bacilli bacterium]
MKEKYLVINAGSSSLKFTLYSMPEAVEIVNGLIEKIGEGDSSYTLKFDNKKISNEEEINNHTEAVKVMLRELLKNNCIESIDEIKGIGHRVLHGGELYSGSVLIDEEVMNNITNLIKLGPLHLPGEIAGINSMIECLPDVPQVAVFDTAFHQTMPEESYMYPVPYSWYKENGVRKYGFHGISHKYITKVMQEKFNKQDVNLIVCHIGSGASITAIKDGKSYDTTMGLTPLPGLVMGTRCGDIDPSIIEYICKERNLTVTEVTNILNKESGLKGLSGKNDFRDVTDLALNGDSKAKLAIALFERSVIKYIGQYYFELEGNLDAIVFTAGVGENVSYVREDIINFISKPMGIEINKEMNDNIARFKEHQTGIISTDDSKVKVMVILTDEEYMILEDTYKICNYKKQKVKGLK